MTPPATAAPPPAARPLVYGHRGARADEPENTLRSFRHAHRVGAEGVELDVRVSRDGRLVVIHDATVDRTTDGTGEVASLSLAELRELDAGRGERIPTLSEALDAFPGLVQVEIKAPEAVEALAELDRRTPLPSRAVLTSFHPEVLDRAARLLPRVERGLITATPGEDLPARAAELNATWVCPELTPELTARLVERCHAQGLRVDAWPAADARLLARCVALGADAVTTDHPALIDGWLGAA
ncbi:glycerophosphodiester phosphodiesterase family protein [Streptomyces sparsogenes]|uniref:glycerophosphodiester phosphodiesterase n=1 Tax=Streptomyces sparsogenes TaxID=67365 RepID=UPI0033CF5B08